MSAKWLHYASVSINDASGSESSIANGGGVPASGDQAHQQSNTAIFNAYPDAEDKRAKHKGLIRLTFSYFFLCASRMERKWRVVMQANKIHYFISSPRMHYDNQSTEVLHSAHTKLSAHSAATNSAELIRNILLWWCCQAFTSRLLASTLELLLCYHLTSLVYIVHVVAGTSRDNSCLMCHVCKIFNSRDRCIWAIIKYIG